MRNFWVLLLIGLGLGCEPAKTDLNTSLDEEVEAPRKISPELYQEKMLGMLVGSAIGDAMGAPTEMIDRQTIQFDYGFVTGLDTMMRAPSPEGTWKYNLPAGGSTDDTRWKVLMGAYLKADPSLEPKLFAQFISGAYQQYVNELKDTDGYDPEPFEEQMMKMTWLREWALVAKAFDSGDPGAYGIALSKFYGGEMSCAGMLYTPMVGALKAGYPNLAYESAFDLSIFDIGFARDMSALVAAMTASAFDSASSLESIMLNLRDTDPQGYHKSRLVGRSAFRYYQNSRRIVEEVEQLTMADVPADFRLKPKWKGVDTLSHFRLERLFSRLDAENQDVAFHPAEVFQLTVTALMYSKMDFEKAMEMVVNYGRDNDTVAAIVGAIIGAHVGISGLPQAEVARALQVNKEILGIDLQQLALEF